MEPESPSASSLATRGAVAADAWIECAAALKEHDEDKIQGWKEEIDTHLVFVSLPYSVQSHSPRGILGAGYTLG